MSDKENIPNESDENEEERKKREMNEFAEKYFSIRAEMQKLDKEEKIYIALRERFVRQFIRDFLALSVDFYPEYEAIVPVIKTELSEFGVFLFDDVVNLCEHYKKQKSGYFRQLHVAKFEFITRLDLFRDRTDIPKYHAIIDFAKECFEEEYVDGFYFECYRKHIHLLLKRLTPDYIPEIYDLPSQGFRELDGFLYLAAIEIFDIIREASPIEAG